MYNVMETTLSNTSFPSAMNSMPYCSMTEPSLPRTCRPADWNLYSRYRKQNRDKVLQARHSVPVKT